MPPAKKPSPAAKKVAAPAAKVATPAKKAATPTKVAPPKKAPAPAKKPAPAKVAPQVTVTLKQMAAELAEGHDLPKKVAEAVLGDLTVWELQEDVTTPLKPSEGLNGSPTEPTSADDDRYRAPTVNSPTQANRGLEWATRTEDELVQIEVSSGNIWGGNHGK